jgi:hypothetical protein
MSKNKHILIRYDTRYLLYHTTVNRLMTHRVGFSHSFNSVYTQRQFAMIFIRRVKSAYEKNRNSNSHACVPLPNGGDIRVLYNIVNFTFCSALRRHDGEKCEYVQMKGGTLGIKK